MWLYSDSKYARITVLRRCHISARRRCVGKAKSFLGAIGRHWWFWMGVALNVLGIVPAVMQDTIPPWIYWFSATICIFIACFLAWNEEYKRADMHKREADEMYSNIVLDYLQQHHPMSFPASAIASSMDYDLQKVERGLKVLEGIGVTRDDGALGWFYNPAVSIRLYPDLRKLATPKNSN